MVSRWSYVLLPIFTALHRVTMGQARRHLLHHLTFAFHWHAAFFMIGIITLPLAAADVPGSYHQIWALGYLAAANQRAYGGEPGWRTILFVVAYALSAIAVLVVTLSFSLSGA